MASRIGRIMDDLYGDGRLQPARPSFITRSRPYARIRSWILRHNRQSQAITAIKAFHSAAFFILAGSVIFVAASCAMDRFNLNTRRAATAVAGEVVVILFNGGRCPLTSVVEDLGSDHGSVSDIFLPDRVARNIPQVSTSLLGAGLLILLIRRAVR